jgi:hypothetical protein
MDSWSARSVDRVDNSDSHLFGGIPIWYMQLTGSKSLCDIIHGEV